MVVKSDGGSLLVKGAALDLGVELGALVALAVTGGAMRVSVGEDDNSVEIAADESDADDADDIN
jgi:hypothetical protein